MNQIRSVIIPVLVLVLFCLACKRSQNNDALPDNLLDEGKFRVVMIDVLLADAYVQELPLSVDSQKLVLNKSYAQIFDRHNVSKEAYYKTLAYYNRHPDQFFAILEPVKDSLSTLDAESRGQ